MKKIITITMFALVIAFTVNTSGREGECVKDTGKPDQPNPAPNPLEFKVTSNDDNKNLNCWPPRRPIEPPRRPIEPQLDAAQIKPPTNFSQPANICQINELPPPSTDLAATKRYIARSPWIGHHGKFRNR